MELNKALGLAIRKVRKLKGLTQEDFEPLNGRVYISKIERGLHSPSFDKLAELAGQLGVSTLLLVALALRIESEDVGTGLDDLVSQLKQELKGLAIK